MRKKEKRQMFKIIFGLVALFVIAVVAATVFWTPAIDAKEWILNLHEFLSDIGTDVSGNIALFAMVAAILGGSYYFLVYKPKR
jgi:hypothetical protein